LPAPPRRACPARLSAQPNDDHGRAGHWLRRHGAPALLLSWVPIVGDGIVVLAGATRVPFLPFSLWTAAGKGARYAVVAWLALQ
jgi:membrane protein YqaA with SNARE-associated domain